MSQSARARAPAYAPLLIAAACVAVVAGVAAAAGLRLNLTGSIPPGIYRAVDGSLTRGAIVLACLPVEIAGPAHDRGYLPSGSCPGGAAPIGKPIVAVAGDTVGVDDMGVVVNGGRLPNSRPLAHDSHGKSLNAIRVARHVVKSDELWLVSSHSARSFDSRYFGPVTRGAVRSRLNPVLVGK